MIERKGWGEYFLSIGRILEKNMCEYWMQGVESKIMCKDLRENMFYIIIFL
jgi:hypothetical protein